MKKLFACLLLPVVVFIQTSLDSPFVWRGVTPDFILLFVVYFNLYNGEERGLWYGLWGGVAEDILSGAKWGSGILCKTVTAYLTSLLGNQVVLDNPLVQALLVLVVSFGESGVRFFLFSQQEATAYKISVFWGIVLPQGIITAAAAPFFFWAVKKSLRRWERIRV